MVKATNISRELYIDKWLLLLPVVVCMYLLDDRVFSRELRNVKRSRDGVPRSMQNKVGMT